MLTNLFAILFWKVRITSADKKRLQSSVKAINTLAQQQRIIMPLHPRTKAKLKSLGLNLSVDVLPPQNHRNLLELIKHSSFVLTDSGGVQKEAFYLAIIVLP